MQEKCNSCGADIEYSPGSQTLKCPYCGANNEIKRVENALPDQVEKIVPLTIDRATLENQVYRYMASGDFTPDDMLEIAVINLREFIYVPAYRFDIDYSADWTASFGFDRSEPYTAYRTVYRNNSSHQEAYTAYRTVTDWRPVNGSDSGSFAVATYAGKQLNASDLSPGKIVSKVLAAGGATDFNPSFTQGIASEAFCVSESAALASLEDEINANIDQGVKVHRQGDHQKDWRWKAKMTHEATTCYAPLCHASFVYDGKEYHFWMGGNGVENHLATKLPEDKNKKKNVDAGFAPFWAAVITLAFATYMWRFTWTGLITVGVAIAYAGLRSKALKSYSKAIRQSLLTQIEASSDAVQNLSDTQRAQRAAAFQRPAKPFFAKTQNDETVLPGLGALAILVVALAGYLSMPSGGTPPANQPQIAAQAGTPPLPQAATPSAASQTAAQTKPEFAVASISVPVEAEAVLRAIMDAAGSANWTAVDIEVARMKQLVPPVPSGDVATARAANAEGQRALRDANLQGAIDAFVRAVNADVGNNEYRDNLTLALLKKQDADHAMEVAIPILLTAPDSSTGWADAAYGFAKMGEDNQPRVVECLRLALRYSKNRQKTLANWSNLAHTDPNAQLREGLAQVMNEEGGIPHNGGPNAPAQQVAKRAEAMAPMPQAAVSNAANNPPPQGATQRMANNTVAQPAAQQGNGQSTATGSAAQLDNLYVSAVSAMRHGHYDHAIEIVDNALTIAPGDSRMLELKNTLLHSKQQSNPTH